MLSHSPLDPWPPPHVSVYLQPAADKHQLHFITDLRGQRASNCAESSNSFWNRLPQNPDLKGLRQIHFLRFWQFNKNTLFMHICRDEKIYRLGKAECLRGMTVHECVPLSQFEWLSCRWLLYDSGFFKCGQRKSYKPFSPSDVVGTYVVRSSLLPELADENLVNNSLHRRHQ